MRREPLETVTHNGFVIEIYHDENAGNPWEAWDCEPPIIVHDGRGLTTHGITDRLPRLTREQIRRNVRAILEAMGYKTLLRAVREFMYRSDDVVDCVNYMLSEEYNVRSFSNSLQLLADIYRWADIPVLLTSRTGYSQGDWVEVLVVATPDWCKSMGFTTDAVNPEQLEASADLYAGWAFGDVYEYGIPHIEVQGCGFYGSDHEKSGLLGCARSDVMGSIMVDLHDEYLVEKYKEKIAILATVAPGVEIKGIGERCGCSACEESGEYAIIVEVNDE